MEFSPSHTSVGKVSSVPPPATAFMPPAIRPAPKETVPCVKFIASMGKGKFFTVTYPRQPSVKSAGASAKSALANFRGELWQCRIKHLNASAGELQPTVAKGE